ncbi:MAG TPA: fused MFS/spermidine synthase [Vitreimonas sp.]|nr:fused MFS/spermidine synthase [Vitreimonas sp.]
MTGLRSTPRSWSEAYPVAAHAFHELEKPLRTRLVYLIFVLSGAAGLIYEIVWARQLVLVFGNTTQAVSAILTGFFGGMAIGSVVGGRIADRVRSPLRLYGVVEIALVVVVILTPVTFQLIHELYRGAYGALQEQPQLLGLIRFALALLALGPATVMMGATLPALTRHFTRGDHLSGAFGRLYALNTMGAILGTLFAGLVLIELLGLTGALIVGAGCSAIAGIVAVLLARGDRPPVRPDVQATTARGADIPRPTLALLVAFVSGLTSLGYQVVWTRLLSSGTGSSTYVFTIILALFLIGIVLGAMIFGSIRSRVRNWVLLLAGCQLLAAILVVAGLVLVLSRPAPADPYQFGATFQLLFGSALVVVLPATIVLGLAFPAASALLEDRNGRVATAAGQLLAANTLGAICGTFAIPFIVIPSVGSPAAIVLLALVNAATAVALALARLRGRPRPILAGAGTAVVVAIITLAAIPGVVMEPAEARIRAANGTIEGRAEDEIASVQAGRLGSAQHLWVGGTSMTLLTVDARLMPILPLMARPEADSALIVAFGMGSSYRTALIAGLEVDAVELVPSVVPMFRHFYPDAEEYLRHPRGRVIVADGRNHMELTDRHYDLIVTDPPPPIESAGVSVISSYEYYRAGRARLNIGGLMMQWMPYGQTVEEFKAHVRTFRAAFPNVLIAFGPGGYGFFMLGSDSPVALDQGAMREVLERPGVLEDISGAYDSPEETVDGWIRRIESLVWASGEEVEAIVADGPLITDDRPLPEYFLLRRIFAPPSPPVSPRQLERLTGS